MYIGVTLLYSFTEKEKLRAVLKSYVIDCNEKNQVYKKAKEVALTQIKLYYPHYKYLGIDDVFSVSGEISEGEMLGRTSFFELTDKTKAIETLCTGKEDLDVTKYKGKIVNVTLVYYYDGIDKYTLSVLTILNLQSCDDVINRIKYLTESEKMIDNIVSLSVEKIDKTKLTFIGIGEISVIEEDLSQGGSFDVWYSDDYVSEKDMLKILPTSNELKEIVEDVFEVLE